MNRRNQLIAAVLVIALALGAYWWYSPILVIDQMQQAATRADADGVNEHVDYAALRENLRGQYSQAMARKIGQPSDNPLSALGSMIGMAFINQMVDAMARPDTVAAALTTGRMKPPAPGASAPAPSEQPRKVQWQTERKGHQSPDRAPARGRTARCRRCACVRFRPARLCRLETLRRATAPGRSLALCARVGRPARSATS